jgi:hypothetical protein
MVDHEGHDLGRDVDEVTDVGCQRTEKKAYLTSDI